MKKIAKFLTCMSLSIGGQLNAQPTDTSQVNANNSDGPPPASETDQDYLREFFRLTIEAERPNDPLYDHIRTGFGISNNCHKASTHYERCLHMALGLYNAIKFDRLYTFRKTNLPITISDEEILRKLMQFLSSSRGISDLDSYSVMKKMMEHFWPANQYLIEKIISSLECDKSDNSLTER